MPLRITYRLEFPEHLAAIRHHHRIQTRLVAVVLLGMGILFWILEGNWYMFACTIAYVFVARPYIARRRILRTWNRTPPNDRTETVCEFDDEGMRETDDAGQATTTTWDRFYKTQESPGLFLLYLSPRLFICIPKLYLTTPEQNELRKLLREHVGPRLPDEERA